MEEIKEEKENVGDTGEKKQKRSLFRAVLPLDAGPHANVVSLKGAAGRVVSAPHMFMLPRALALYSRKAGPKARGAPCRNRLGRVPDAPLRGLVVLNPMRPSQRPEGQPQVTSII